MYCTVLYCCTVLYYTVLLRYMTLTHGCNTPWADAAQVEQGYFPPRVNGISQFGEKVGRAQVRPDCRDLCRSSWR